MILHRPTNKTRSRPRASHGLSLLELVIVLVIMAVLSSIAITRFSAPVDRSEIVAAFRDLQTLEQAVSVYHIETEQWPADQLYGVFPPELEGFLAPNFFDRESPIGGVYDWNNGFGPFPYNVAIRDQTPPQAAWERLDLLYDDDDLITGNLRRHTDHLCLRVK